MFKRAVAAIFAVAIIFAVGLFFGGFFYHWLGSKSGVIFNTATLLKKVQTLSQFVTVKYNLEKVVVLDERQMVRRQSCNPRGPRRRQGRH